MSSEGECVKVVVRCRPANTREKELKSQKVVKIDRRNLAVSLLKGSEEPKTFTFDNVYDDDSLQKDVYDETAFPLVKSVMEGYNGTIFAYGQTGCGKTFTMEGIRSDPNLRGIIPRTFDQIFDFINTSDQNSGKKFLVAISYVEIYNEEVRDLLSDNPKIRMDVKEDPEKGVFIKNLSQPEVTTVDQIEAYMNSGNKNRSVGATAMNATSSRSHSLFTVRIETSEQVDGTDEARIKAGKLNLVDLAGSERQSKTEATGDRLKEAQKINLSLSALGNVISALVVASSKGKGEVHIPYRDSKLTRLLQDSLGGNTKTIMIAALSPAADNYDETLSTLRYANRAKNIKNKPKVNEDPKDAMLREFQDEIKRLKAMLEQHGLAGDGIPGGGGKKKKTKSLDHDEDDDDDEEEEEEEEERPKRVKKARKLKKPKAEGEIEDIEDEEDDEDDDDDGDIPDETDGSKPKKKSRGGLRSLDPFASPAEQEKFADEKAAYEAELAAIQLEKSKHETFIRHLEDQMKAESAALDELKTQTEAEKAAALAEIESRLMKEKEEHETKAKELEEEIRQTKEEEQKRVEAHKAEIQSLQNEALNEKLALKAKLKKLQQKLIDGGQKHKTAAQEAEEKARLALEEAMKTRQAEAREREAKLALEEEKLMLEENYTSIKDEVIGKTKKLKKLKKKLLSVQQELDDSRIEWEQEKEGYLANIRDSAREVKLYRQIAAQLLTKSDLEKIVRGSVWQEAKDEWQLPKIDLPVFFPTVRLIPGVGQNGGPTGSATATGGAGAGSASSSSNNGVRTFGRRFEEEKGPDGWKKSVTAGYSREDYQPNANGRAVSRMAQQSVSTNPPPSTASHRPPPPTVVPKKLDSLGSGARKPSSPDTSDPITASAAIARRPAFEGGHVNNSSQEDQREHILNVLDSAGTKATFVPAGAPISNNHYSSSTDSILNDLDSKAPRKASFQPSGQFPSSTQPSTDDAIHTLTHTEVAKRPAFSPAHAALPSTDTYDPLASTLQNGPAPRAAFNPLGSNPLNSSFDSDVVKKPAFDPRSIDPDIPKATLPMDLPVARSFQPAGALVPARLVAATQAAFGSANDPIISPKAAPPPRPAFSPAKF